jgi:hypothetical protein
MSSISIFGGSNASGYLLGDSETYENGLRKHYKEMDIVNHAVDLSSLNLFEKLYLESVIDPGKHILILHYSSDASIIFNHKFDFLLPKLMRKSKYWNDFAMVAMDSSPFVKILRKALKVFFFSTKILRPRFSKKEYTKQVVKSLSLVKNCRGVIVIIDTKYRRLSIEQLLLVRNGKVWEREIMSHPNATAIDYKLLNLEKSHYQKDNWHLNSKGVKCILSSLIATVNYFLFI